MKRSNPFQPIYALCNQGEPREKIRSLPPFPRYIDVELTNDCNFRCLMCAAGAGMMKRPRGYMTEKTVALILEQIAPHKTPLRFVRWGESLLHLRVWEYVARARGVGCLTHLNTNGRLLCEATMDRLLSSGLDSLKFSFQGVDAKSYGEMRNTPPRFFGELLDTARGLWKKRGDAAAPFIHISTTITSESPEQVGEFRGRAEKCADLVTVGRTVLEHIDPEKTGLRSEERRALVRLKAQESVVKKHPRCPEVFDKLSINWDGSVSACCGDYDRKMLVGHLAESSLAAIWRSDRMGRYRRLLADMRHDEIELCSTCYDYHGLQTPGLQKTEAGREE